MPTDGHVDAGAAELTQPSREQIVQMNDLQRVAASYIDVARRQDWIAVAVDRQKAAA